MRRTLPVPALAASIVVATAPLAACSDELELTVPVETVIELEAAWQCDVTRFSFPDTEAIEAKGDALRDRYGVTPEDHATFTEMLEDDQGLRDSVAEAIDARCPVAGEEVER